MKTLRVTEQTWHKLVKLKAQSKTQSIDQVIKGLLKRKP